MKRDPNQQQYLALETRYLHQLDQKTVLRSLDDVSQISDNCLIEILLQRRYLSLHFTLFCDMIMCALEDDDTRQLVADIVRAEYANSNHRDDFVQEIVSLGWSRRRVVAHEITETTRKAARGVIALASDAAAASDDLTRLVVLRFFGEVTPGHEFRKLFLSLEKRGLLKEESSKFLWPHVEYDVHGTDAVEAHAARYLSCIGPRLMRYSRWSELEGWVKRSTLIRQEFYGQFECAKGNQTRDFRLDPVQPGK